MKLRIIFSVIMSFCLSFLISGWITWINLGLSSEFLGQWMHAFSLAWPAAMVVAFIVGPSVQKLSAKLCEALS